MVAASIHDELVNRLPPIDGHFDTLGLFADADFSRRLAGALADEFRGASVTKVAGIEARGFVLATAVAAELGVGFVAVRKAGSIHPGPKAERRAPPDWRGDEHVLRVQRAVLGPSDRALVVDDWAETGSKALTAKALIEDCGATFVGLALLIDQLQPDVRDWLSPVFALARADELVPGREGH